MNGLNVMQKSIFTDLSYYGEIESLVISHCRYKELIIFTIGYFLLRCPLYSISHILSLELATENYSLK